MGWEYSDTDCIFANVCSFSPRCLAKSKEHCSNYQKDERSFWEKHFGTDYGLLKEELERRINNDNS
jgi:hypothetical protein